MRRKPQHVGNISFDIPYVFFCLIFAMAFIANGKNMAQRKCVEIF